MKTEIFGCKDNGFIHSFGIIVLKSTSFSVLMESLKVIWAVIARVLIGLILISGIQEGYSQTSGDEFQFTRHRLQFIFDNGFLLNKAELVSGEHVPETAISFSHSIQVNYLGLISKRFSLQAGYALGIQAFSLYVAPYGEETGNRVVLFTDYASYFKFQQLSAEAAFRFNTGKKSQLSLFTGGGAQRLRSVTYGCSSSVEGFEQSRAYLKIEGNWFPFATAGGEYYHALKNSDQLSVRLFYQHSFRNWYQGTYYIYEGTCSGDLHATGSRVSLGVGYVFTGIAREGKIKLLEIELGSRRVAKQQLRRKNRYVDPSVGFLSVYSGFAIAQTRVFDPNQIDFRSTGFPRRAFGLNYEKGIGSDFFIEGAYYNYLYHGYAMSRRISFSMYPTLNMHNISIGTGLRVCQEGHLPLLSVHAGFFSGIHLINNGLTYMGSEYSLHLPGLDTALHIDYSCTLKSNVGIGLYTGLSKDLRISNKWYLSAIVRYQWGIVKQAETQVKYRLYDEPEISGIATGSFRNTAYYAMLGLKYKL